MPLRPVLRSTVLSAVCVALTAPGAMLLTGCGIHEAAPLSAGTQGHKLQGMVHGGQQPISGATLQLYAASKLGYAQAATPLLTTTVTSDVNGRFSITGDYTCPAGSQVYLTATGGNPGLAAGTNNTASVMMAALGPCTGTLDPNEFIFINEVTTVGAAYSLAQFATDATHIGASATNPVGIANAFATANNITDYRDGQARTQTPYYAAYNANASATGGKSINNVVPQARIHTLANILAGCVNSAGAASAACTGLFNQSQPPSGSAPRDTFSAVLSIAQNPGNNVAGLYGLATPNGPFQPSLSAGAPNDWIISVVYTGGGIAFVGPPTTIVSRPAIDAAGNVWIATNQSVVELNALGEALSPNIGAPAGTVYLPGGFNNPSIGGTQPVQGDFRPYNIGGTVRSVAIDPQGHAWVGNTGPYTDSMFQTSISGNGNLTVLDGSGTVLQSNITGSGLLSNISSLAIDGSGNVWTESEPVGSNSGVIATFSPTGQELSPVGGLKGEASNPFSSASGITLDSSGHAWIGSGNSALTLIDRTAYTYLAVRTSDSASSFLAIDQSDNAWSAVGSGSNLGTRFASDLTSSNTSCSGRDAIFDGLGNCWAVGSSILETDSGGTMISPVIGGQGMSYTGAGPGESPFELSTNNGSPMFSAAFDESGNLWVGVNKVSFGPSLPSVVQVIGLSAPVVTPTSVALGQGKLATRP